MAEEKKKSSNKTVIILLLIVIILLLAGVAAFFIWNATKPSESENNTGGKQIPLEITAGVLSPDKLKEWNEEALREMEDNQIPMIYSPTATSKDGVNFECEIGNPAGAKYYMYLELFPDTSLDEDVYLSGLLEPGKGITSFSTSKTFPKGETDAVLVLTTVREDKQTLVAQTMVYLTLQVG